MSLTPPVKSAFDKLSEGTHLAICDQIILMGEQATQFGTKVKLYIRFEVPTERTDIDGKSLPKVLGKFYTYSLSEGSNLRKDLESWRGKKFNDDDLTDKDGNSIFDVSRFAGKPCQIVVAHNGDYANIIAVIGLAPGTPAPKGENPVIVYDGTSLETYNKLSEKLREKIKPPAETQSNEESTDDIPW